MKTLFKKIFHTQITGILNLFTGLVTTLALTWFLSPEDYGIYSLVIAFVTFASVFLCQNLFAYTRIKIPAATGKRRYSYLKSTLILPIVLLFITGLILRVFPGFSKWILSFFELKVDFSILLFVIIFFDIVLRELKRFFQACSKPLISNNSEIIFRLTYLLIIGVLILYTSGIAGTAAFENVLIVFCTSQIFSILYLLKSMDLKFFVSVPFNREVFKRGYPFALTLLPLGLTSVAVTAIDRGMISSLCGFAETARYSLAFRFISPVSAIISCSILLIVFPYIASSISKKQKIRGRYFHLTGLRLSIFFSFLFFLLLLILAIVIKIYHLSGQAGHYGSIYKILPIIGMIPFFESLFLSASNTLQIMNRIRVLSFSMPIFIIINFVLNLFLIPHLKAEGAAIASVITFFLFSIFSNLFLIKNYRKQGYPSFIGFLLKIFLIALIIFVSGIICVFTFTVNSYFSWFFLCFLYVESIFILFKNGLFRKKDLIFFKK